MPDDPLKKISDAIRKLANRQVLIGIPGEGEPRSDSAFGNVSRGYVF